MSTLSSGWPGPLITVTPAISGVPAMKSITAIAALSRRRSRLERIRLMQPHLFYGGCTQSSSRRDASRGEREHHFGPAVENQIDPDEQADDPEPRNRPRTPNHQPQHNRDDPVQDEPAAMMQCEREGDEEPEGSG